MSLFQKSRSLKKLFYAVLQLRPVKIWAFAPGDLKEKIDPYLAPLYDSLEKIIPKNNLSSLLSDKKIEIIPLAYMRGRT